MAVLTDFEQFVVLDCRYKPNIDTARSHVLHEYHYRDYGDAEKFAKVYYLFSREAVAGGSLQQYAATLPKRRGKGRQPGLTKDGLQRFDDAFLAELDEYRDTLAHSFKNRNPELDGETLTEITQRVIDRLVFMRFLEDKMIHPEYMVAKFGDNGAAWKDFVAMSRRLDAIYNGIVFKKHALLDADDFAVDDAAFLGICRKFSHLQSAYLFDSIPIHILGSIYERFLGKVIVTTDKRARVEEKPEVRKAGGVYYTPDYIVRYIVENTVGKLIEGKSPAQIAEMRREILLNNIYGVDIDRQAVEVSQLSLYLKLLEEETTATARAHQLEFHETLLPSLSNNIVCGNSLIGTDILEGHLFEPKEEKKLNPMDFVDRFPAIMKRGGFDAIVGNPPYIFTRELIKEYEKDYYNRVYKQTQFKINTYLLFAEKGFYLLKDSGQLGFITPNNWLTLETSSRFRHFILSETRSIQIVNSREKVFESASVDTSILVFGKTGHEEVIIRELEHGKIGPVIIRNKPCVYLNIHNHIISYVAHQSGGENITLLQKISYQGVFLETIAEVRNGIQAYTVGEGTPRQTEQMKRDRVYHGFDRKDSTWVKYVDGVDVGRYELGWSKQFVKYGINLTRPRKKEFFQGERLLVRQIPASPPYSILTCYVNE
ncbi:MAG: Eco57I restriction-modification methylase domain-containing protein [Candidatus Sumerlaeota bacterium]|nr:Eco57I restriction-modification methylase domain-containing protein [Candidatus Sumerlaeota bacterium]